MSWSFWGMVNNSQPWQRFFDWGSGAYDNNLLMTAPFSTLEIVLDVYAGSSGVNLYPRVAVSYGEWYHYTVTLTAQGVIALYVNGVGVFASGTNIAPTVARTHMYLGKSLWSADSLFNGAISDFQFANGFAFTPYDVGNMYAGYGCPLLTGGGGPVSAPPPPPAVNQLINPEPQNLNTLTAPATFTIYSTNGLIDAVWNFSTLQSS